MSSNIIGCRLKTDSGGDASDSVRWQDVSRKLEGKAVIHVCYYQEYNQRLFGGLMDVLHAVGF